MIFSTYVIGAAVLAALAVVPGLLKYLPYFKYDHVAKVDSEIDEFNKEMVHDNANVASEKDVRRSQYTKVTESFYNLITDFYEYGWGQSFHFAPRYKDEGFHASIRRYEHYVASQLGLPTPWNAQESAKLRVLDVGCGIGGPMRAIAKFFKYRVRITGVNITQEHIRRATKFNAKEGIKNCDFIRADFNNIPVADSTFDAIYDFEATLHSTDLVRTFTELYRVLKPGGRIVTAQYCLLDDYDAKNERHVDIIRRVDNTNGCYCSGRTTASTVKKLQKAGFKILSRENVFSPGAHSDIKFSECFESTKSQRFTGTKLGLWCTYAFCFIGETLRLLPRGTAEVQRMLMGAAESFKEAGRENILTPGMLFVLEKPRA